MLLNAGLDVSNSIFIGDGHLKFGSGQRFHDYVILWGPHLKLIKKLNYTLPKTNIVNILASFGNYVATQLTNDVIATITIKWETTKSK